MSSLTPQIVLAKLRVEPTTKSIKLTGLRVKENWRRKKKSWRKEIVRGKRKVIKTKAYWGLGGKVYIFVNFYKIFKNFNFTFFIDIF